MSEFIAFDSIKEIFHRQFGDKYQLVYSNQFKNLNLVRLSDNTVLFTIEYDNETNKLSSPKVLDDSLKDIMEAMFPTFEQMTISNYITTIFFEHPLVKIIFKDPVNFDDFCGKRNIMGKRITLNSKFQYRNAWHLIFVEMVYFINKDFTIKPVVDFNINMLFFGQARIFIDEVNKEFLLFSKKSEDVIKPSVLEIENDGEFIKFFDDNSIDIISFIDKFMLLTAPVIYNFYLDKFNITDHFLDQYSTISINDFKVLEMLKV